MLLLVCIPLHSQWNYFTIEGAGTPFVFYLVTNIIGSPQWNVPEDGDEISFSYFLPNSDRGFVLAMDFIAEGVGYDFWAMPWERLEHLATLKEGITISLLDGVVLWARNRRGHEVRNYLHQEHRKWGESSGSRNYYAEKNHEIARRYREEKVSMQSLADEFHLSVVFGKSFLNQKNHFPPLPLYDILKAVITQKRGQTYE